MLLGCSIIDGKALQTGTGSFFGFNPATGQTLEPPFHYASISALDRAARLAEEAFSSFSTLPAPTRAGFLRQIAAGIEAITDELVARAMAESGLPEARLRGELARTSGQLRLFATVIEEGSWANARIDPSQTERKPLPRADLRSILRPLGPIAVFGSSNFPLAFSVAGGDTASALAAGNPVIVKAHSAHPGTSELVGQVIAASASESGIHPGVFALIFGRGNEVGSALVKHPAIKGVGFTGSEHGGRALMDLCASRPDPIPCFTEMSSVNPVFVLPEALKIRSAAIAAGLFGSFTMGVGQFCTKPGLVFLPAGPEADTLVAEVRKLVAAAPCQPMLTEGIANSYKTGSAQRTGNPAVATLAQAAAPAELKNSYAVPALFEINGNELEKNPALASEIFGPSTLVIRYLSREQMLSLATGLTGQLTATLHATESDLAAHADLVRILERKAGRLVVNGFPTGVEVSHAMVHGGPCPATSDPRFTSVGTLAIYRWARPVCYQDFPQAALPEDLRDANPNGILRLVNGQYTRDPIA